MQVKCWYEPLQTVYDLKAIDQTIKDKDNEWSTTLGNFSNGRGIPIGFPEYRKSSELYILGGRRSIVEWLRVQGPQPVIYAEAPLTRLHVHLLRKKRLFDKDLTALLVSPQDPETVGITFKNSNSDWELKFSGSTTLPYTTPTELATVLEHALIAAKS